MPINPGKTFFLLPLIISMVQTADAAEAGGVTVNGTRLIYDGNKKEAFIDVSSSDNQPYLVQSWAEDESGGRAPFIVTPPLFRLDANQKSIVRVVHNGTPLPTNQESLYWLNIKTIPSLNDATATNTLQIAVKSRLKLIYRPKGLEGSPEESATKLSWLQNGNQLTVKNPTPFYFNFNEIRVDGKKVNDATFVPPMGVATFTAPSGSRGKVTWKIINDYGAASQQYSWPQ
jgi:P pilus assembly chaperone PapD